MKWNSLEMIDKLAMEIMGWEVKNGYVLVEEGYDELVSSTFSPQLDLNHTFMLVNKVNKTHWMTMDFSENGYGARIGIYGNGLGLYTSFSPTIQEAVIRAIAKWKGWEVE